MEIKGSKTEANLMTAFSGECMARVKYEEYADRLEQSGHIAIAALLKDISRQEKKHAAILLRLLEEGDQTLEEMMDDVCAGEKFESEELYPSFAAEAERENFGKIAELFQAIAQIERRHAAEVEAMCAYGDNAGDDGTVRKWGCRSCGHVYTGTSPAAICPVCGAKAPFGRI